ncbi:efflux RND transporter periplasmic adaptor subunit [Aquimarina sp. BL5]|uniref:efflux RND transporter periplasmic adaptor subunit n=1 Tax=Aquimarina sp. BL5 TaxID=1714860 RepID=UPI000E47F3CB|nr:efflux RND transporter periplasmic adaptor subunit [Aquimarina sp. BL5]AXT52528.1 efflux RND transporter periplasmic adaptor subunit [Aquimarina sp. BL5]RKN11285.1 efflux RND transporter periplasmic adaptor subunit [Aquimarina sp. BL5]
MKKNIVYIGIALLTGLLLGYLIFGRNTSKEAEVAHAHNKEVSDQTWTCSMHPQIMQSESGDCPICGMDLIPTETNDYGLSADQFKMTENAIALANIQTSIVGGIMVNSEELKLSGKIKENEEANTAQVTHFSGRMEKLFVNSVGEQVDKGQAIATIYSPELVAAQQELLTASKLKKNQPELYKAVRNKLKLRKLSEKQINQIESSGEIKETFTLYSHVSGVVSQKMVEEGNHIDRGQILYRMTNLSTVWASFDVYENQIGLIKKGQSIKVKTNAYPNENFDATISFIDPILNATTRTITARAVLKNSNSIFKPGMFVEGIISVNNAESNTTILIPKSSILWTGERSVVYVKTQSDQAVFEIREVILGDSKGDSYLILEGLKKGEEIVTNGTFTVDAAAQLQGKKSMMQRNKITDKVNDEEKIRGMNLPNSFQKEFAANLSAYFLLKNALVASNPNNASLFSERMLRGLKTINTSELQKKELHNVNMIIQNLEGMVDKEDLKDQREHFVMLNESLEALIKNLGTLSDTIYIQKCPMANSNKGAIWLSKEEEIRNPYFGDQMLTCGSVIETLSKN